jgi:hypothetical protein
MTYNLIYDTINNVPVIVLTTDNDSPVAIAIDYTAQVNAVMTAIQNIALVGTTDTPLQANGFITRSKYEDYFNIAFLRYIIDPATQFSPFPSPPSQEEQASIDAVASWVTAANTYLPPSG